jgi:hypothetical protein
MAVLAALDYLVIHRRRNKKAHGQHQEGQSGALQAARQWRQLVELILKNPIELKTEQNLRAKKQKPVFIQRGFEFVVEFHLINWNGRDEFGSAMIMDRRHLSFRPAPTVSVSII